MNNNQGVSVTTLKFLLWIEWKTGFHLICNKSLFKWFADEKKNLNDRVRYEQWLNLFFYFRRKECRSVTTRWLSSAGLSTRHTICLRSSEIWVHRWRRQCPRRPEPSTRRSDSRGSPSFRRVFRPTALWTCMWNWISFRINPGLTKSPTVEINQIELWPLTKLA